MSQILVATDLSPRSELAFGRALQLASQEQASVRLLFVIDDALPASVVEGLRQESENLIAHQLLPRAAQARIEATVAVRPGRPFEAILGEADAVNAVLIVLGTHRQDETRDLFVGSTAWRVLRESRRPVLQVKNPASGPYRRVLAAIDFTAASQEALLLACRFSAGADFSAVHAFRVPFVDTLPSYEVRQEASDRLRLEMEEKIGETLRSLSPPDHPFAIHAEVQAGDVLEVIRRECDRVRPDLLVIGTRGRAGAAEAFHKSIAESLLRRPPCDIAAVAAVAAGA